MLSRCLAAISALLIAAGGCGGRNDAQSTEASAVKQAPPANDEMQVGNKQKKPNATEKIRPSEKQEHAPAPTPPTVAAPEAKQFDEGRSRQKREAKEKLLLLEKEQAKNKIEDLMISVRQDEATLEKNRRTLEKADADWNAQRLSTFESAMLKTRLEGEDGRATSRRDKFLNVIIELEDKIKDIDAQLKALYEESLQE